jgi:hypothetical protein
MTMRSERRRSRRYPVSFYIRLAIEDQIHRCYLTELSSTGLYAQRPIQPLRRNSRLAQAEIRLPGTDESIWAGAELIYDRFDSLFHGSAYKFTTMARQHREMLQQWLDENQPGDRRRQQSAYPTGAFGQVLVLRPERCLRRVA